MVHWGMLDFQFAPMSLLQINMLYIYLHSGGALGSPMPVYWFTWSIGSPGAGSLVHGAGSLVHWCRFTGSLVHWFTGSPVHRCTGSLAHRCTGALVHWFTWCRFTGSLVQVHWFTGALVHWFLTGLCTRG